MNACVIGAGSWGSAFALYLGRKKIKTRLWVREADILEQLQKNRENKVFLPGFGFPPAVSFYSKMAEAIASTELIFIAVPSQFCRAIYTQMVPFFSPDQILISLTKGIEKKTLKRMSEVIAEIFSPSVQPRVAVLSGPSFSREVAENHPTALVLASPDQRIAKTIQHLISSLTLRVYTSCDVTGVELAGALKNVIAIAAGISEALNFGSNSLAALMTRGLAEITRLGVKLGAKKETFSGLAGIGDLVLTCTGKLSRNRSVGLELGKGNSLPEIISNMKMVAEGISTTLSAYQIAHRENVEMAIFDQVYQILYKNKDPKKALLELMSRRLKQE
ncbi:MAG: NAD(P)H-dependent glycerol-3-phosphate dehydrogenase [Candidatus Aminicenantales bacterium]